MAEPQGPQVLQLSWILLPSQNRNGIIRGYSITVSGNGMRKEHISTTTSLTVSSLHPFYVYQCSVAAFTNAGTGPYSGVTVQMPEDGRQNWIGRNRILSDCTHFSVAIE